MVQKELLDSIKKHLGRFEAQVRISNANNEYDINIHAENVLIPLLNLAFSAHFKNVNFSEGKNTEVLDLIDDEKKIGIQVTSTRTIEKIKQTLSKFTSSRFKNKIDVLYIYVLVSKQASYTQYVLDNAANRKIKFIGKEHILDSADVYRKLYEGNDLEKIKKAEEILRKQFTDIHINQNFTFDDFEIFRTKYQQSCKANFSRINFFGLAVNTNKPREIELYLLFVQPTFISYSLLSRILPFDSGSMLSYSSDSYLTDNLADWKSNNVSLDKFLAFEVPTLDENLYPKTILGKTKIDFDSIYDINYGKKLCSFSDLFSQEDNIVIIGKPGAGKSSLIKFAICKILDRDMVVFENQLIYEFLPFRIELHKYNKFKKNTSGGFIEYISDVLKGEYQLSLPEADVTSVLTVFHCVVFFDGLDEIFDVQERLAVRNDIETFVSLYKKVKSVTTSRFESYQEVSLSEKMFQKFELQDFDDSQIHDYVNRWYSIEESNTGIREKETIACLSQLQSVESELKHNPLLLSLILLLYRNELDIPTSKLSIYESCTNTIVETRDVKEKKLDTGLRIVNKLSVFAALAYWQFSNESEGHSIPNYEKIKNFINKYLIDKGEFTEDYIAGQATDEFLNFAKIRSIYFENKFTHKTFLEYFTAYYIFSFYFNNWKRAEESYELFQKYVGLSAWSVVLELLICKIDSTQIDYVIIDDLVEHAYQSNPIDTIMFLLQVIKYLRNISPRMIRFIITQAIDFSFKDGENPKELKKDYKEVLFSQLCQLGSLPLFKTVIKEAFTEVIVNNKIGNFYVNAFAYEFAIISGDFVLVDIVKSNKVESGSPYIFILQHYNDLSDNVKFIEAMTSFMKKFSPDEMTDVYNSPFGQKIFFNSTKFNWVVSFLATKIGSETIHSIYQMLISADVSKKIIVESAISKSAALNINDLHKAIRSVTEKDSSYRRFVKNLQNAYIPVAATENSTLISKKIVTQEIYDRYFRVMRRK